MESNKNVEKREDGWPHGGMSLAGELQQGKEFARQLQMLLHTDAADAPPHQAREYLVSQIIASLDRAVSIAHQTEPLAPSPPPPTRSDSPLSAGPTSSDDSVTVTHLQDSRTRATQPRWKMNVQVSPETGFEGPPGDGYNWRKYGQKEILHAEYPRAYYRCALKNQTGCPATKQVQRCDSDSSVFEVTYKGLHTCNHPPPSHPNPNTNQGSGKETLISFNDPPAPNRQCFLLGSQQQAASNPNPPQNSFRFHATSSGPTATATPTAAATSSASATSSPMDFPSDQFDFDALESFFH